jgi:uncharacterized protein (TIGR00725 family)
MVASLRRSAELAMRRPIIGVMGAAQASGQSVAAARELGRLLAERGWIVLTGGRPAGIMAAAAAGAKEVPDSLTLGILPDADPPGPDIDIAVATGMGDARNVINVLTSDVVVACAVEGPGTASEVALGLKVGKPVVLLQPDAAAAAFFRALPSAGRLFECATPRQVAQLLEHELGIAPWNAVRLEGRHHRLEE